MRYRNKSQRYAGQEQRVFKNNPGIKAHFIGDGSGRTLRNRQSNSGDGNIIGCSWTLGPGNYGHALDFDGTSANYVTIPAAGLTPFSLGTISVWARPKVSLDPS